jgi:hypothetical protein
MTISRRMARLLAAAGVAGVAAAGGTLGLAAAQTSTTTTPPSSSSPSTTAPSAESPKDHGGRLGRLGGLGGNVLHGEFVVPKNGGFETIDVQTGKVTDVSQTSITVQSDDNFSKTYAVADTTVVNAGRDGIASVKKDDTVRVTATVDGSNVTAVDIIDTTNLKSLRERWLPTRPDKPGSTSTTTAPTS